MDPNTNKTNFRNDLKTEALVNYFMRAHFYDKIKAERIIDRDQQRSGIDMICTINGKECLIDEKSQSDYILNPRDTFALELEYNNKGITNTGWFLDKNKKTTHYMFIWPKADRSGDNLSAEDISCADYALVEKKALQNDITKRLGLSLDEIEKYSGKFVQKCLQNPQNNNDIRRDKETPFNEDIYLTFSPSKPEHPVNLVVNKKFLIELAGTQHGHLKRSNERFLSYRNKLIDLLFNELNNEDKESKTRMIKDTDNRICLVSAGPGSGKTEAIVRKIEYMILTKKVEPEEILLLTFTNAAIDELKERTFNRLRYCGLPIDRKQLHFYTFHSYAAALMHTKGSLDGGFIGMAIDGLNMAKDNPEFLQDIEPNDPLQNPEDYTDLVYIVKKLAKKKALFLDEAQDMTNEMHNMVKSLMDLNPEMKLTAVFDVDQSLYEFEENVDPENILNKLVGNEKNVKTHEFLTNYRANKTLVEFSENYRKKYYSNTSKNSVFTMRKGLMKPYDKHVPTEHDGKCIWMYKLNGLPVHQAMADIVYSDIESDKNEYDTLHPLTIGILVHDNRTAGHIYTIINDLFSDDNDIFVKQKINRPRFPVLQLDEFDAILRRMSKWAEHDNSYSHKALSSLLGMKSESTSDISYDLEELMRSLDDFKDKYKDSRFMPDVLEFIKSFLDNHQNENPMEMIDSLKESLKWYTFEDFINKEGIFNLYTKAKIRIIISTIHKAKGREFDHVYVYRPYTINKDSSKSIPNSINCSEIKKEAVRERYVAITRAKKKLTILDDTYCPAYFTKNEKLNDSENILFESNTDYSMKYKEKIEEICRIKKLRDDTDETVLDLNDITLNYRTKEDAADIKYRLRLPVTIEYDDDTPNYLQAGQPIFIEKIIDENKDTLKKYEYYYFCHKNKAGRFLDLERWAIYTEGSKERESKKRKLENLTDTTSNKGSDNATCEIYCIAVRWVDMNYDPDNKENPDSKYVKKKVFLPILL